MRYKVITLIMLIPIVLMLCLFSAAGFTSINVPISVSGVTLFHENLEVVNLAESDKFQINAQVYPKNSSNKGLSYTCSPISQKPFPTITISENGLIQASGYGTAKVTVSTKDGNYKKSFILEVTSTVATELVAHLEHEGDIYVGDEFNVLSQVLPSLAVDKNVKYSSSNSSILQVNSITGRCKAVGSGNVKITACLENGLSGKLIKEFNIAVLPADSSNPITFNGSVNFTDYILSEDLLGTVMEINFTDLHELGIELSKDDIELIYDTNKVESVDYTLDEQNEGIYRYNLDIVGIKEFPFNLKAKLKFENYEDSYSEITLIKDIVVNSADFKKYIKLREPYNFSTPKVSAGYEIKITANNDNIVLSKVENSGESYYTYVGTAVGVSEISIDVLYNNQPIKPAEKFNVEILDPPTSFEFLDINGDYGIEELLTVGNEKIVAGGYVEHRPTFKFIPADVNYSKIIFESLDEGIAKFVDGELQILNEGKVTIKATHKEGQLLGIDTLTSELTIRCVKGVEVGTYDDLVQATDAGKQVVLTANIDLGKQLVEDNNGNRKPLYSTAESKKILQDEVKQMDTTFDWSYYKHSPDYKYTTPPQINYIMKFTNNLYGNGYELNADNISNLVDGANMPYEFAVFQGPLDMVGMPNASVKAQDNICFIATDGVMLNNVILTGAKLEGDTTLDLGRLEYVGTVLEIMGDDVKIVNSRIKNGRNCIRVFGKEGKPNERINVLIESCEVSHAREFLIKMGTNAKLTGEFADRAKYDLATDTLPSSVWEACSPKIEKYRHLNDGTLSAEEYEALLEEYNNDAQFQALIKTNLTIQNCVLHTSGLFSIGIESSFAGPALDGAIYGKNKSNGGYDFGKLGWLEIAGTSYPTMLNLKGDVKIYDWKKLDHIDSTILIDGSLFDFDMAQMIENLNNQGGLEGVLATIKGEKYAHGGIVMYGGGKNYSLVNFDINDKSNYSNFTINLDQLDTPLTKLLKYASGKEDFRFFMCGQSSNFNYNQQVIDLQSGEAYKYLRKYTF